MKSARTSFQGGGGEEREVYLVQGMDSMLVAVLVKEEAEDGEQVQGL